MLWDRMQGWLGRHCHANWYDFTSRVIAGGEEGCVGATKSMRRGNKFNCDAACRRQCSSHAIAMTHKTPAYNIDMISSYVIKYTPYTTAMSRQFTVGAGADALAQDGIGV